jgi:hypothetical protein
MGLLVNIFAWMQNPNLVQFSGLQSLLTSRPQFIFLYDLSHLHSAIRKGWHGRLDTILTLIEVFCKVDITFQRRNLPLVLV